MARASSEGLDPRYPPAFQRGGSSVAPVVEDGVALGSQTVARRPAAVARSNRDEPEPFARAASTIELRDERHFELVVAGNPWLRALWVVGAIAMLAGLALTVYAEFAFSVPPASGIYDPSVYVVPRVAEAVAQPLSIAGVIALVAAAALRIVAWRPSNVTAVIAER